MNQLQVLQAELFCMAERTFLTWGVERINTNRYETLVQAQSSVYD
jgi:hypothetical protein